MTTPALIEFRKSWQGPHNEDYFNELERLSANEVDPEPSDALPPVLSTIPPKRTATVQPPSLAHGRDILERASAKQRPDSAPDHALRDVTSTGASAGHRASRPSRVLSQWRRRSLAYVPRGSTRPRRRSPTGSASTSARSSDTSPHGTSHGRSRTSRTRT